MVKGTKQKSTKSLGQREAYLIGKLYDANKSIFRLKDVARILQNDKQASKYVNRLITKGIVSRLVPGLYTIVPLELGTESEYMPNKYVVAREVVGEEKYYLSHGSAMEIHQMLTQPLLTVYVTTTRYRKDAMISGVQYRFVLGQKKAYFGLSEEWVTNQDSVIVSDLERTMIDAIRRPRLCGGISEVAKGLWIRRGDLNINRLIEYALRMGKGSVINRLGFLLELYNIGTEEHLGILKHLVKTSNVTLDPGFSSDGEYLSKWRLRLNVPREELISIIRT